MSLLNSLAAGPVGLLVGAVIGLILTVLIEDQLKSLRSATFKRLRLRLVKPLSPYERKGFTLGPLKTDFEIIEGDGEAVIPEDSIYVSVDNEMVDLPTEIAEWKEQIADREAAKRQRGEQAAWNGESYAIERFVVSRKPGMETPEIFIRLK